MEINKYTDIVGALAMQNLVDGRMVVFAPANPDFNYGSREDLMGVRYPANTTEAARARYVVTHALDNRPTPILETIPSWSWALRGGWDQASNVPFTATVHLTHLANTLGQTITSGNLCLAFDRGVFTVPSGAFVYSANLVPFAQLEVLNVADDGADAGKLSYVASNGVAFVERYNSTTGELTFRTL